nr:hypothetical protein [uncultured Rhodoferax sp.]
MKARKYLVICSLAALSWSAGALEIPQIPPGGYVYQGGSGELQIQSDGRFSIDTVGGNAHTCQLEGMLEGPHGRLPDSACRLTFSHQGSRIRVHDNGHPDCRIYCGARALFTGVYRRPSPACTNHGMAATRQAFKVLLEQEKFAAAAQTLSPLLRDCAASLHRLDAGWVRNDLAQAQLRNGDAAACLQTLRPLQDWVDLRDTDLHEIPEPVLEDSYLHLAKVTRTRLRQCRAATR